NLLGCDYVNRVYLDFLGVETDDVRGYDWSQFIHPDDREAYVAAYLDAMATSAMFEADFRFRRHDGEYRSMRSVGQPRLAADGTLLGYTGITIDVTEQIKAERELRASEAHLAALIDQSAAGIAETDLDGRFLRVNDRYCEMVGRSREELLGLRMQEITHPDHLPGNLEQFRALVESGRPFEIEKRYLIPDGSEIWVSNTVSPVRTADEGSGNVLAISVDITARKNAEAALQESEARFRRIADSTPVAMWVTRVDRKRDFVNQAYVDFLGVSHEEAREFDWRTIIHPDDADRILGESLAGEASLKTFALEGRYRRHDGLYRWMRSVSQPRFGPGGEHIGFIGAAYDITEAKEAEAALLEERGRLETLNRTAATLAGELDVHRLVQQVTDAALELSGAQVGAFFYNVVDRAGESYMLFTISGVDRALFEKFPMPRKTAIFAPTFDGTGIVRSDDITSDPRYGKSDTHHGMPKEHLPVRSYLAVPVISRSGDVLGGLLFGHPDVGRFTEQHEQLVVGIAGQAAIAIDNARLFESAQREIAERSRAEAALTELNQSLEQRIADAIAGRERTEEALRQAQKMEAVGQLTGGIAHDFNNLLTVIAGNLDLAARRLGDVRDPKLVRALDNAMTGALRAATLTQRLLAFSRRQPLSPKSVDANTLVTGMIELLHRTLGETIEVETRLAAGLGRIDVDSHQLESAILNLAVNARDAMPDGGKLTIETAAARLAGEAAVAGEEIAPGDYVMIRVSDTGLGMSPDTLRRAVEPFFTTKEVGKGTGLGLSMVYGFVSQSGGQIRIESEEGQGTRIALYLPRHSGRQVEEEQSREAAAPRGRGD
ncbi:MAG: PAS domain S-box protein, partial [Sphingosinicella sp.]